MAEIVWTVQKMHKILVSGSESERFVVQKALRDGEIGEDEANSLMKRLHASLTTEFSVAKQEQEDDQNQTILWTRTWLINLMGEFSKADSDPGKLVRQMLTMAYDEEPYEWVRYWGLTGIIRRVNKPDYREKETPALVKLAQSIVQQGDIFINPDLPSVKQTWVHGHFYKLAVAILTSSRYIKENHEKRREYLDIIKQDLASPDKNTRLAALRALRYVPVEVPDIVKKIIEYVRKPPEEEDAILFEAIMALGALDSESPLAHIAAHCLRDFISNQFVFAKWDAQRTRAIIGLGYLKQQEFAPTLLDALKSDNPAIAREAARALENVLGIERATARIVEAATDDGEDSIKAYYADALRRMSSPRQVVDNLEKLRTSGLETQRDFAQKLLVEVGGAAAFERLRAQYDAFKRQADLFEAASSRVDTQYDKALASAQWGFRAAFVMDGVMFMAGIILFVASIVLILKNGEIDVWAAAGFGAGLLTLLYQQLLANPRALMMENATHQSKLNAIFLSYLRRLTYVDQSFTQSVLGSEKFNPADLTIFDERAEDIIDDAIEQLEQVSESSRNFLQKLLKPGAKTSRRKRRKQPSPWLRA